jgi:hypothetical protein
LDTSNNPAGMYHAPDENVKIKEITLTGANVNRKIVPSQKGEDNTLYQYLSGEDYAHKASFCFLGLAEGEYELTIRAKGHETYTGKYEVVPGKLSKSRVIELKPLE